MGKLYMACKLYCSKASTKQILCTRSSISWRRCSPKASASPLPPALHKTLKYKCGHLKHFFLQRWEMNRVLEGSVFRDEVFFFPICGILHPKEHRKVNKYYGRNMSSCCNCAHVTVGTGKQGLSPLLGDQLPKLTSGPDGSSLGCRDTFPAPQLAAKCPPGPQHACPCLQQRGFQSQWLSGEIQCLPDCL